MNEGPITKILILGGRFASLYATIRVDTETKDLGGSFLIMALIGGDIKGAHSATRTPIGRFFLHSKLKTSSLSVEACVISNTVANRTITRCESAQDRRYSIGVGHGKYLGQS
jgi:hypothetical protein